MWNEISEYQKSADSTIAQNKLNSFIKSLSTILVSRFQWYHKFLEFLD